MTRLKIQNGFTLIELIMVIVVLGIIIGMSSSLITQGLNAFLSGEDISDANWQGQVASQRMSRDLSLIRSPTDIATASATSITFTDIFNNSISYSLSGSSLILTQNGTAQTLADGISTLSFTYYDTNGVVTATTSLIRYIQFSINVTLNGVNYTLATLIYPRNLI